MSIDLTGPFETSTDCDQCKLRGEVERLQAVVKLCEEFVAKHEISCGESIYQMDRGDDDLAFLDNVCALVGYFQEPAEVIGGVLE